MNYQHIRKTYKDLKSAEVSYLKSYGFSASVYQVFLKVQVAYAK